MRARMHSAAAYMIRKHSDRQPVAKHPPTAIRHDASFMAMARATLLLRFTFIAGADQSAAAKDAAAPVDAYMAPFTTPCRAFAVAFREMNSCTPRRQQQHASKEPERMHKIRRAGERCAQIAECFYGVAEAQERRERRPARAPPNGNDAAALPRAWRCM